MRDEVSIFCSSISALDRVSTCMIWSEVRVKQPKNYGVSFCVYAICREVLRTGNLNVFGLVLILKGSQLLVYILKFGWHACIYLIWEERNHRAFRNHSKIMDNLLCIIKKRLQIKVHDKSFVKEHHVNCVLCVNWRIIVWIIL
ncbi:hypothetical protein GQ457_05G034600 [Hibiscus cannabinus]